MDWLPTNIRERSGDTYIQKKKNVKKSVHNLESFILFREFKTTTNCAMNKVDVEIAGSNRDSLSPKSEGLPH